MNAPKHAKPPVPPAVAAIPEAVPAEPERIVQRPDGYHWIAPDGRQEFGPFASYEEACAYRDRLDEAAPAPERDDLLEVEEDIGIADWVDPDTGELAEGQCPPHLSDD